MPANSEEAKTRTGSQVLLIVLSERLLKGVGLEDFVELSKNSQPTQYTGSRSHTSKSPRRYGSPPEYGGIESLEDLRAELRKPNPDWGHMARCYLHLSSILRY